MFFVNRLIKNLAVSAIDNILRDKATPVVGSVVYCDLAFGYAEHSGIYIGRGRIAHLDGSGLIEAVTPKKFLDRLGGMNSAISIYVSCKNGKAVGDSSAAARARLLIGSKRSYNVLIDNCHQFTSGCISGNFENSSNFLTFLKSDAEEELGCNEWRVWDI